MSDQTDMEKGFLKDKLGNYQVNPPDEMWNEISERIGGGRSRRRMILLFLASAASIALAISLGVHFFGPDIPRQETVAGDTSGQERMHEVNRENDVAGETERSGEEHPEVTTVPSADRNKIRQAQAEEKPEAEEQIKEDRITAVLHKEEPTEHQEDLAPQDLELRIDPSASAGPEEEVIAESDTIIKLLPDVPGEDDALAASVMDEVTKREPRWTLGAALSPLYSYRDAGADAIPDNRAESGLLSYSTGIHLSYRRNSRLAFETGIYFNKTGISIGAPGIQVFSQYYNNMVFGTGSERTEIKAISNSVGNIIAYSGDIYMNGYKISAENGAQADASEALNEVTTTESGIQQHLDFLELPFNLRYSIIDRRFELQLVGGISTNFLVNNYVTMETSLGQEEIGYLSNVKTVNYSGNAGLGMIYHMGGKFSLLLEPRFRYFINSVNDSTLPSTRPYSLGFYTGLSYTF
jgi:hypothetical protein